MNFEHQGFVSLQGLPDEIRGEDVAFLAAVGPVAFLINDFNKLPSGAFPLSNPGMFFDAVASGSISANNSSSIDEKHTADRASFTALSRRGQRELRTAHLTLGFLSGHDDG
jgi:hypothetical protein